ncbi:UNVERIFIED_CONTAM: hypothetical protein RMT77_011006 [Armadillidium vulgare]
MESEKFHLHVSGETVDKGWHGKVFETDFGKFLLFRLICQRENFRNFRFTREKKGTGKFDDFLFAYDCDDGKTKYSLIQLKHLNDETKKINFEDLKLNSKSYFGLPYYFDYYSKSQSCLSSDKDLKETELEDLIFYTNAGIEDALECISKREIPNEGLFRNSGKLYKLSINEKERREIFHEQFLSERKRLANELSYYVMQNKQICLGSLINDDSYSLIHKFSEMLLDHVIDVERNKFKTSFLDPQLKNINKELDNFRNEFFDSLFAFQKNFPSTKKTKSKELRCSFPTDNNTEGFIEFLKDKTISISTITEQKTIKKLSEDLVLSVMLQKPFDIESNIHGKKKLGKLIKFIREEVIDFDARKVRETFLTENSKSKSEIRNFRLLFLKDIKIFCENLKYRKSKEIEELLKFYNSPLKVENLEYSLNFILEKGEIEIIEFLKDREIRFTGFFDDIETCTEIFPSGEVDATEIDKNIVKFLNLLTFAVHQNNFKTLISDEMSKIITRNEDQKLLYKEFNNFMDTWHNEGVLSFVHFESRLNYRKWITEEKLLNNVKKLTILFQNREVKISDICSGCEIIEPEIFMYSFTTNAIMKLGESIDKVYGSFYIPRTLVQSKRVNINSLIDQQSQDIIIVTIHEEFDTKDFGKLHSLPVNFKDLQFFNENHNYYYTKKTFNSKFFMNFCTKHRNDIAKRTIHWITFLGKDFKYESSCPDSIYDLNITEEFFSTKLSTSTEFVESENLFIITGDPGSGKSVLLKHLSIDIKNLSVDRFWVIPIPLNNFQKYLDKYDEFTDVENVIDFLAEIENCESDFSKKVLSFFLFNNRLILLFDGFDEIHNSSKHEKILGLLKFLKNENLTKQIWITSRPHCVSQIESVLGCVAFEIKDISEDEQINLVINEWKVYHSTSQVNLIEENASNFVKNFKYAISNSERDLLGVPLLTYMFAHAYINEAMKPPVFLKDISLVQLFENFISSKFNVFFTEKVKTETIMQNDFKSIYEKKYQVFALKNSEIISPERSHILSEAVNTELSDESIEMLKRIGLIYESSNVCTFIHETFAEYYIADLLVSIVEKCIKKKVLHSVMNILRERGNRFILYIFDTHVIKKSQRYKIFESITSGDEEFVTSLNKESLSTVDILGRNCFYYALQYKQFPILHNLMNKDVELIFEPFFVNSLKGSVEDYFLLRVLDKKIYLKLLEYILEKEKGNGHFDRECLDQCLKLDSIIYNKHWKIAAKLITKFNRKLDYPSLILCEVANAPEEFFDVYMQLMYKDENPDWPIVLNALICFQTDRLKEIIVKHRDFILRLPVCRSLLDEKDSLKLMFDKFESLRIQLKMSLEFKRNYLKYLHGLEEMNLNFVNSVKLRTKNFSLLFKFLFESKDVSFEEFNKTFLSCYGGTIKSDFLPIFSDISLDSLKLYGDRKNEPPWNILYGSGLNDETLSIALSLLSKGDEEQVKKIYNKCLSYDTLEKASQYWEEAKRKYLSKYYKV